MHSYYELTCATTHAPSNLPTVANTTSKWGLARTRGPHAQPPAIALRNRASALSPNIIMPGINTPRHSPGVRSGAKWGESPVFDTFTCAGAWQNKHTFHSPSPYFTRKVGSPWTVVGIATHTRGNPSVMTEAMVGKQGDAKR